MYRDSHARARATHSRAADVLEAVVRHVAEAYPVTAREREVLGCVLAGKDNREIATALGCGPKTVETHVSSLLRKLGVATRLQLATASWLAWATAADR